jgi:transcriptional regulator with XRE-family HTH domain
MATNPFLGDRPRHYLREWRKHRKLKQDELAFLIGKTRQALSRWERHERGMTLEVMFDLFEQLDIMPGQFFAPPGTPDLNEFAAETSFIERNELFHAVKEAREKQLARVNLTLSEVVEARRAKKEAQRDFTVKMARAAAHADGMGDRFDQLVKAPKPRRSL